MAAHRDSPPATILVAAAQDDLRARLAQHKPCFAEVLFASTLSGVSEAMQNPRLEMALISPRLYDSDMEGLRAIRQITSTSPVPAIVLLERYEPDLLLHALVAGAKGVYYRGEPPEVLCAAMRQGRQGKLRIGRLELETVLQSLGQKHPRRYAA